MRGERSARQAVNLAGTAPLDVRLPDGDAPVITPGRRGTGDLVMPGARLRTPLRCRAAQLHELGARIAGHRGGGGPLLRREPRPGGEHALAAGQPAESPLTARSRPSAAPYADNPTSETRSRGAAR